MLRSLVAVAFLVMIPMVGCSGTSDESAARRALVSDRGPLDTLEIPAELRPLAPLAAEWGIGDDVRRDEKVRDSRPEERAALRQAVLPHDAPITAWLDSFGEGSEMSNEAAAYMYMRLAIEEMPEDG
jgi:hypothetical protein